MKKVTKREFLKKLGLVTQEPYGDVELTAKGRRIATMILNRHNKIREFLMRIGVSQRIADKDACLMEHILSAETMARIHDFLAADKVAETSEISEKTTKKECTCPKTK